MAAQSSRPVTTVTIGFRDATFNETPYARQVTDRWKTDHHEYLLEPNAVEVLPEIVWHYGEPFADPSAVPTYYVAQASRKHAIVFLNGDGRDELFGGYARPSVARAAQAYRYLPLFVRKSIAPILANVEGNGPFGRKIRMLVDAGKVSASEAFTFDHALRSSRTSIFRILLGAIREDSSRRPVSGRLEPS